MDAGKMTQSLNWFFSTFSNADYPFWKENDQRILRLLFLASIIFCLGFYIIFIWVLGVERPDIGVHILSADELFSGKTPVPHPLFFALVKLFSFFGGRLFPFSVLMGVLYSLKVFSCYYLMKFFDRKYRSGLPDSIIFFLAWISCFIINFRYFHPQLMNGLTHINIFFNGTFILGSFFAIIFFVKTYDYLFYHNDKNLKIMFVLSILGILSKPSFWFSLLPAFLILGLYFHRQNIFNKYIIRFGLLCFFCLLMVLVQKVVLDINVRDPRFSHKFVFEFLGYFKGSFLIFGKHILNSFFYILLILIGSKFYQKEKFDAWLLTTNLIIGLILNSLFHNHMGGRIYPDMNWQTYLNIHFLYLFGMLFVFSKSYFNNWMKLGLLFLLATQLLQFAGHQYLVYTYRYFYL